VQKKNKLLWPALLLLLAGFVVFALPQLVPETADREAAQTQTAQEQSVPSTAKKTEASPWQDAQLARQRKAAQDSLQQLLDLQFELEEQGLASWGLEELTAVKSLAEDGDNHYKQREYQVAQNRYQEAFEKLQQLKESIPQRLDALLKKAQLALLRGEKSTAAEAFAQVLQIEPGNSQALAGQDKVAKLDDVMALRSAAEKAMADAQWSDAARSFNAAIALFPEFPGLKEGLQQAQQGQKNSAFDASMGRAYQQLSAGNFAAAERSFRQALKAKPGDAQARAGIEQALAEQDTQSIQQQLAKAKDQIISEDWEAADASYRRILTIDATVKSAQQQHALVKRRLKLDQALQNTIADPLRLSSDPVYKAATALLDKARQERPRGARLAGQIATLSSQLDQSQQLLSVALNSDGLTDVILLKVARLGRFSDKTLQLKPGNYTLLGSRDGYRDVRVQFSVRAGQAPPSLGISCTDKI
jgi:Tfp pilus assembly protein PilF